MPAAETSPGPSVHEWALAEAVVSALSRYAREVGTGRIRKVVIALGELQSIDREIFEFALHESAKLAGIDVGSYELIIEKAVFECRACGRRWRLEDLGLAEEVREAIHFLPEAVFAYARCPDCGSPDFAVVQGRGLSIVGVEP